MMSRAFFHAIAVVAVLTVVSIPADAEEESPAPTVPVHKGFCEASGAVTFPEGSFGEFVVVIDNEDNRIRAFAADKNGSEVGAHDVSGFFGLKPDDDDDDMDLEAATWFNHRPLFIGSLGRSKTGKRRPAREHFFTLDLSEGGNGVVVGEPLASSAKLLPALAALDYDLAASIDLSDEKREELAPKDRGINLEGMTTAADGTSIILGFRNPLPDGKALLVKLLNPEAVLFEDAAPDFAAPVRLDLKEDSNPEGRGVRGIEYSDGANAYFIVAGHVGGGGNFDIYRWVEGETPTPIEGAAEAISAETDFAPEGIVVDATGTFLQLFSDDEDFCDKSDPSFRSMILPID